MPLFDPEHEPDVRPEDAAVVVHRFLARCRDWATEREIPRRLDAVRDRQDPVEAGKLHAWIAWRRFCEHAMAEIEDGTLDPWLDPDRPEPPIG